MLSFHAKMFRAAGASPRVLAMVTLAGILFLGGCNKDQPTVPLARVGGERAVTGVLQSIPALKPGDAAAADSIAKALALTLADGAIRRQLFEDLRDSPFPQHRIHLASYLSGPRGEVLARSVATRAGISVAQAVALASTRGGFQLIMPRAVDRMNWTGTEDIAIKGLPRTLRERREKLRTNPAVEIAHTIQGVQLPHGILTNSDYPFLEITPADIDFGPTPEVTRHAATRKARPTISTPEEEIALFRQRGDSSLRASGSSGTMMASACDDPTVIVECEGETSGGGGSGPRPMGVTLPSGKTYTTCFQPGGFDQLSDGDQDGVDDACEYELAFAFRPQTVLMTHDCDWLRQPHFAVRQNYSPYFGGVIVIFYAISYHYDCGPPFACPDAIANCRPHNGDSEWIVLEVGPSAIGVAGPWSLKYGTLSSHWGTANDQTAGYEASDLEDAQGSPGFGAPRIWVSEDKHGNYRTRNSCNGSGFSISIRVTFPRTITTRCTSVPFRIWGKVDRGGNSSVRTPPILFTTGFHPTATPSISGRMWRNFVAGITTVPIHVREHTSKVSARLVLASNFARFRDVLACAMRGASGPQTSIA
ncbi:MAG: hypothetical protein WKF55_13790 [Gemmatimonadaceae bacterium]